MYFIVHPIATFNISNTFVKMHKYIVLLIFTHWILINNTFGLHMKVFLSTCRENVNNTHYIRSTTRSDLLCPRKFENQICEKYFKKRACACNSLPHWDINKYLVLPLHLEYMGLNGTAIVSHNGNGSTGLRLFHRNGYLSKMPKNLCTFPTTVEIVLSHNRISAIESLSCLKELDTIDLSHNRIRKVFNNTFRNMHKLRVIDLSYNRLKRIEPYTFSHEGFNPLKINISDNHLSRIDFSNVFMLHVFCLAIYARNNINIITNELGYTINLTDFEQKHTFGGFVDLSNNFISYLPNPAIFGLNSLMDYGELLHDHFWTHFNGNKFVCDCNIALSLKSAEPIITHYTSLGARYFGLVCSSPLEMTSIEINNLSDKDLSQFQCKRKACHQKCNCVYIAVKNRIIVDCRRAQLLEMKDINLSHKSWNIFYPDVIQDFNLADFHLLLSENSLQNIPDVANVLNRTQYLDISRNKIKKLQSALLKNISSEAYLNLSFNSELKTLPNVITRFNFDNIDMTGVKLECTCNDVNKMYKWLPDFIESTKSSRRRILLCNIGGKIVDARLVTSEYLGCDGTSISDNQTYIIALILLILSALIVCVIFAYHLEIFIMYRKMKQQEYTNKSYTNDIYVSMDNENEILLRWILQNFCPALENRGYKVYLPARDMGGGCLREELIRKKIGNSRCLIVFLTTSFAGGSDEWMALEWRIAWQEYTTAHDRKLICINYDQLRYKDAESYILRKYMRWGICIDFCTRRKFIHSCIAEIGKPCAMSKVLQVSKAKFNPLQITEG